MFICSMLRTPRSLEHDCLGSVAKDAALRVPLDRAIQHDRFDVAADDGQILGRLRAIDPFDEELRSLRLGHGVAQ